MSFAHPDDAFNVTDCDWKTSGSLTNIAFLLYYYKLPENAPEILVSVDCKCWQPCLDPYFVVWDEYFLARTQCISLTFLDVFGFHFRFQSLPRPSLLPDDVECVSLPQICTSLILKVKNNYLIQILPGQMLILNWVHFISNNAQYVKTRQNWIGQVNVFCKSHTSVVSAAYRIGGRYYRTSGLKTGYNTSF